MQISTSHCTKLAELARAIERKIRVVVAIVRSDAMSAYPGERLALFIDGPQLYRAQAARGVQIDFRRFLDHWRDRGRLVHARFYAPNDPEWRPLRDWLSYNGFIVCPDPGAGALAHAAARTDMAVQLAADALDLGAHVDHIILVSGNAQFCALAHELKARGNRVSVLSTLHGLAADKLRRSADHFLDLADLPSSIVLQPKTPSPADKTEASDAIEAAPLAQEKCRGAE